MWVAAAVSLGLGALAAGRQIRTHRG
jgi:hypothetical protein